MSMFILRRNGMPISIWLGTHIMESPITPCSDDAEIESLAPFSLKLEKTQDNIEKCEYLYQRIVNYFSLRNQMRNQTL
jgi:hypothetical protein